MRSDHYLGGLLLGFLSATALACEHPTPPNMPDDDGISRRAERALKDDVRSYITGMSVYVACVQAEYHALDQDAIQINRDVLAKRNNIAIAELEAFRDLYVASIGPLEELFFNDPGSGPARPAQSVTSMRVLPGETYKYRLNDIRGVCDGPPCSSEFVGPGVD